jgi:hypothetical protein
MHDCTLAENLMEGEPQTYQRLLRTLHDMRAQIEERVRPVAEQVVQAEIERLRSASEQQRSILMNCVAQIDRSILNCQNQIDEYRQTRSDLATLNERLAKLGAEPVVVPDDFPTENIGDLIVARVQGLRAEGKI